VHIPDVDLHAISRHNVAALLIRRARGIDCNRIHRQLVSSSSISLAESPGRVSSASVLMQGGQNLQDFWNAECDLIGSIYRGGICTFNFHSTK
jgi:hypothetical protein